MRRLCAVLAAIAAPIAALGATPALVDEIDVGAAITELRVSADGRRVVVAVQPSGDAPWGLKVIDTANPREPRIQGFLPAPAGRLALAPDGKSALLLVQSQKERHNVTRPSDHEVILLDLSNPHTPREQWRRRVTARRVVLADDASAYAASVSSGGPDPWQTVVTWVDERTPIVVHEDRWGHPDMRFSDGAGFLVYNAFGRLRIADLRGKEPVIREQQSGPIYQRHGCIPAVSAGGYVIVEDNRTDRFGVYSPDDGVARVATLPHGSLKHCARLNANASGSHFDLADWVSGSIVRIDLSKPDAPTIVGTWQLPPVTLVKAAAGPIAYAIRGNTRIALYRLDEAAAAAVDWPSLQRLHGSVLAQYQEDMRRKAPVPHLAAAREMERGGVLQSLEAPVVGISAASAAEILNDYGFWAGRNRNHLQFAETALRRAVALDPDRAVAALNLADLLASDLFRATTAPARDTRAREIRSLYRRYLALGGRKTESTAAWLASGARRDSADICTTIASFANAGRLRDLLSIGVGVPVGDRLLDIVFTTEGTAHVPAYYAYDAETDAPAEIDIPQWGLWGGDALALVVLGKSVHILHYRDPRHPVATASLNEEEPCSFETSTLESIGPKAVEPQLCRSLAKVDSFVFDDEARIEKDTVAKRYGETEAIGTRLVDFANSGRKTRVAELVLTSGAGAGCGERFYDALTGEGDELDSGPAHLLLMQLQKADPTNRYPILPCGNAPRFFEYRGNVYFENKPKKWPPIDSWNQYHRVARVKNGEVADVCDFRFKTTVRALPR